MDHGRTPGFAHANAHTHCWVCVEYANRAGVTISMLLVTDNSDGSGGPYDATRHGPPTGAGTAHKRTGLLACTHSLHCHQFSSGSGHSLCSGRPAVPNRFIYNQHTLPFLTDSTMMIGRRIFLGCFFLSAVFAQCDDGDGGTHSCETNQVCNGGGDCNDCDSGQYSDGGEVGSCDSCPGGQWR